MSAETALEDAIRARLQALAPRELHVVDDSARHAGHAEARGGGHFRLRIVSARFTGLARVARHRLVYDLLSDLIPLRIHALALELRSPDENPDR